MSSRQESTCCNRIASHLNARAHFLVACAEGRSALCPKRQICLSVCKFWLLSFRAIVSFLAYLSWPLQSHPTSTHTDSDQYSFQTLVWLSLPRSKGPPRSPILSSGLVWLSDWREWGPKIIRGGYGGGGYKDMGWWYDNTPLSPFPSHLPFTFPSVLLSVLPWFSCAESVPCTGVNQKWHVTPTPQWCADKLVLE